MTQTQFILTIIAIIPLLNAAIIASASESPALMNFSSKFLPLLFLVNLVGLYGTIEEDGFYFTLMEVFRDVSFGFMVDSTVLIFLFLLSFLWLIFSFYSKRFFELITFKNSHNFQLFFALIIAFLNLVIISKNLLTTLFFYNFLIILSYFFAVNFLHKNETRFSRFFMFLLYLESLLVFLAIVATYKFTGKIEFINGSLIAENFDLFKHSALLFLYFCGLFLSLFLPFYLFYQRNISLEPIVLYVFFFLAYALSSLFIFVRILNFIFGFKGFGIIIDKIGFSTIEIIFLINITLVSGLLLFSKSIKSSFFYLFFQRFIFVLFAIFFFAKFDVTRAYLPIYVFCLEFTLLFLVTSNFSIYFAKAENKKFEGLFYQLTITCSLLLFVFGSMIGIVPSIGLLEKFLMVKIIIHKKLWLSAAILGVSGFSLLVFFIKSFRFIFLRSKAEISKTDNDIAKDIDFDSSLVLTAVSLAILMFLGLIFFPFIINFFNHL
jgi:formate hydrogenlyase subunit 3/multisubunit Na+/H+ antiporter MnhD subunit